MTDVIEWRDWDKKPALGYGRSPIFYVLRNGEQHQPIRLNILAPRVEPPPDDQGENQWDRAVLRWSVRRIEAELQDDVLSIEPTNSYYVIDTTPEDREAIARLLGGKACDYQLAEGRNTYCSAASRNDETATTSNGLTLLAPTSAPICKACELPAADYVCDHLVHPEVVGTQYVGGRWIRRLVSALCEQGQPLERVGGGCRPDGNPCWTRALEVDEAEDTTVLVTMALPEAFDYLNATWQVRYRHHGPLVRLLTAVDAAGISHGVNSRSEFEERISDLADIVTNLHISDEVLPAGLAEERRKGSLSRLDAALGASLDPEPAARTAEAVQVLRRVTNVRNGFGHSGAARKLPGAFAALGLAFPPTSWAEAWDQIRRRTISALATIRTEVANSGE
jgi:hypothetical protein